jgi:hypothetical protein
VVPVVAGFVSFGALMLFVVFVNVFFGHSKGHQQGRRLELEETVATTSPEEHDEQTRG